MQSKPDCRPFCWMEGPVSFLRRLNSQNNLLESLQFADHSTLMPGASYVPVTVELSGPWGGTLPIHRKGPASASPSVPSLAHRLCSAPFYYSIFVPHFWIILFLAMALLCAVEQAVESMTFSQVLFPAGPCRSAVFQDAKGQGPCQEDRPWCGNLLACLLGGQ